MILSRIYVKRYSIVRRPCPFPHRLNGWQHNTRDLNWLRIKKSRKNFVNWLICRNFATDFHKTSVKTVDEERQKEFLPRE